MKFAAAICLVLAVTAFAHAETVTPLGAGLREEADLWVTCALSLPPRPGEIPVLQSKAECDRAAGIYHYKLWLPRGYLAQPHRSWPCVFIASPFGNCTHGQHGGVAQTNSCRRHAR